MRLSGWSASSYYARARYSALPLAMLCVACAVSAFAASQSAQPGVTTAAGGETRHLVMDPHQLLVAMASTDPAAQRGAKATLDAADPAMIDGLLRYGRTTGRKETAQKVVVRMGRKAVPTLLAKLEDDSVALAAGSVLFRILGPLDADRIPALLDCAGRLPKVKNYCSQALATVAGPKAAAHAPALAKAIASEDAQLRVYSIVALGKIGKGAASAVPALRKAIKDPIPAVRQQAQKALRRIGA